MLEVAALKSKPHQRDVLKGSFRAEGAHPKPVADGEVAVGRPQLLNARGVHGSVADLVVEDLEQSGAERLLGPWESEVSPRAEFGRLHLMVQEDV